MREYTFKADYSIGDKIYHVTPDSPLEIVQDISYSVTANKTRYLISWAYNTEAWCSEIELTNHKTF